MNWCRLLAQVSYPNLAETSREARPDLGPPDWELVALLLGVPIVLLVLIAMGAKRSGLTRRRFEAWLGIGILILVLLIPAIVLVWVMTK